MRWEAALRRVQAPSPGAQQEDLLPRLPLIAQCNSAHVHDCSVSGPLPFVDIANVRRGGITDGK
jgi:hypothetical protein